MPLGNIFFFEKFRKIWLMGHSQGGQQAIISLIADESSKFMKENTERLIALAPSVFLSPPSDWWVINFVQKKFYSFLHFWLDWFHFDEIFRNGCEMDTPNKNWYSQKCAEYPTVCSSVFSLFSGDSKFNNASENSLQYFNHHPNGSSLWNIMHLLQLSFQSEHDYKLYMYNHGSYQNGMHYSQFSPPTWNLKLIEGTPVFLYAGQDDSVVDMKANRKLWKVIGGYGGNRMGVLENWDHDSFMFGREMERLFGMWDKDLF
jgi:pimeloyl-ACP methyl ester carboxylesterase